MVNQKIIHSEINSLNDEIIKIDKKNISYNKSIKIVCIIIFISIILSSNIFIGTPMEDYWYFSCFLSPFILILLYNGLVMDIPSGKIIGFSDFHPSNLETSPLHKDTKKAKIIKKIKEHEYQIDVPDKSITLEEYNLMKIENEKMEALYDFYEPGLDNFRRYRDFGNSMGFNDLRSHLDKKNKKNEMSSEQKESFRENKKYERCLDCFESEEELHKLILMDGGDIWEKIYSKYIDGYAQKLLEIKEISSKYFPTEENVVTRPGDLPEDLTYDLMLSRGGAMIPSTLYKAGQSSAENSIFSLRIGDKYQGDNKIAFVMLNKGINIKISNPLEKGIDEIENEMILAIEYEKANKEKSSKNTRSDDYSIKQNKSRPSLLKIADTLTASFCPQCGNSMEGGAGGKRKWYCSYCVQNFNENGVAVFDW